MDIIFVKKKYLYNDSGVFGILTAIILVCLITAIAGVVYISEDYSDHIALQQDMDSALISSYSDIQFLQFLDIQSYQATLQDVVRSHLGSNLSNFFSSDQKLEILQNLTLNIEKQGKGSYIITIDDKVTMPMHAFSRFIHLFYDGAEDIVISAHSAVVYKEAVMVPTSLMMVIDASRTMNHSLTHQDYIQHISRLDRVKHSMGRLLDLLRKKAKYENVFRVGALSFHLFIDREFPLTWNIITLKQDIQSITAYGPRNAWTAMKKADTELFSYAEEMKHRDQGHKEYKKDVIFLTDGTTSTSIPYSNYAIEGFCNDIKRKKGTIYVIVLALPPDEMHQACASSPDKIYSVHTVDQLEEAFDLIGKDIIKGEGNSKENFRFIQ
ncbi:MAG: VWA domain-containing protein [Candidatus Liberibacter ctenarytainae]|uniref:VWA domain-containing protein n=1 Tax=Candidatus Liberibacter ctenarytainae TaxID=2020335 RepID=A0A937DJ73_9HYPH|nr:VWA domain-containing protein [Candidatus Liberibacter ctenarytainae]